VSGSTDWRTAPEADYLSLYVDVHTYASAPFGGSTPRYFTSVTGTGSWRLKGGRNIFFASPTSFRMYVVYIDKVTAGKANMHKWSVNWIACSHGDKLSGETLSTWKKSSSAVGAYMDLDTAKSEFKKDFAIITSVAATTAHWRVFGGSSMFQLSRKGFRLYLHEGAMTGWANKNRWGVHYMAFDGPMDCTLSDWSQWGICHPNSTYHAACVKTRSRKVVAKAANGGNDCDTGIPKVQSKQCHPKKCDEKSHREHVSTKHSRHKEKHRKKPTIYEPKHVPKLVNCMPQCSTLLREICGSLQTQSACSQCTVGNAADFRAVKCSTSCVSNYCAGKWSTRQR
jgi:hypothetical protein